MQNRSTGTVCSAPRRPGPAHPPDPVDPEFDSIDVETLLRELVSARCIGPETETGC